jgi:hypothetical protein
MIGKKINQLATELAPVSTDLTIIGDPTTGVSKKITLAQLGAIFSGAVSFYTNLAAFPNPGTIDVIYCAKDTKKLYLWSGSAYVEVFPSQALLDTYQLRSEKGVSNGYASLDSGGKVPISQLPSSIMEYKGTWNAATNTPTLANGTGDTGDVYICNVAGTVNFGAGPLTFAVGDYVIYSGSIWQRSSGAVGTVTSVAASITGDAIGITGSPITTSGTLALAFAGNSTQYVNGAGNLNTFPTLLSSVGLSMPSAFSVANSPLTANGTIAVTGAGVASQYIRGDGTLANFPTSGGGGSSVAYYFNSSVSQGTLGGVAYRELSKVPIIGAGTDITIATNGYIANYITDAGDPSLLEIPAGNWNFEMFFSASSGGGSPSFYVELYKYDGTTFTLISSSSATPEGITNGTAIDLYTTALAVPLTTLTLTDRLAIRVYVNNSGRTITLHTENSHLCEVITTFTTGLTALNGLTSQVQYLATGTSGTDFNISSATATHTFNLPTASATNRGALSSADWTTFNNKQNALTNPVTGTGTTNYLSKFTGTSTIGNSQIFDNGTNVGIGTATPSARLQVGDLGNTSSVLNDILITGDRVNSNNYYSRLIFKNSSQSGGSSASIRGERSNGSNFATSLTFYTNGTASAGDGSERMRIDASGNLGLGVTPSAWAAGRSISVGNSAAFYGDGINYIWSAGIAENAYKDATVWKYVASGYSALRYEQLGDNGTHAWYIAPSGTAGNAISFTQAMTLDASGRLGIGVTSPTTFLDINSGTNPPIIKLTSSAVGQIPFSIRANIPGFSNSGFSIYDETAAASRLVISSTGNVGIGLNNPTSKLHSYSTAAYVETQGISSQSDSNIITLGAGSSGSAAFETNYMGVNESGLLSSKSMRFSIYGAGGSYFRWSNNGTAAMTLNASGNLGLGVTPSAWGGGNVALDMGGDPFSGINASLRLGLTTNAYAIGATYYYRASGLSSQQYRLSVGTNNHEWYVAPSGTAGAAISYTQAMTLNASGSLGLGTASPSVASGLGLVLNGQAGQTRLAFKNNYTGDTSGDGVQFALIGGSSGFVFQNRESDGYFSFETNGNEAARINASGNLSIGNTNDTYKLDVTGVARVSGGAALSTAIFSNTSNDGGIDVINTGTLASGRTSQLRLVNGTTFFGANDRTYQLVNTGTSSTAADFYIQYYNGTSYFDRFRIASTGAATFSSSVTIAGETLIKGNSTINYATLNLLDVSVGGSQWAILQGFPTLGDFTIRESGVANHLVIKKTTGAATFSSTIQTAAPTNGTAQPWKLGNAVSGGVTTNHYIIVEINGTTYTINALQGLP